MDFSLKKFQSYLAVLFIVPTVFLFATKASFAADVDVYAEGAYTNDDLVLYIYADINSGPILSFGVKVEYPAGLSYFDATKNDAVWYFGEGSPGYPYMNPQNTDPAGDTLGSIIIIGGKLDTSAPTAGVSGSRVLLGKVTFKCTGFDFTSNPAPIIMTYAHGSGAVDDDFKNFVSNSGTVYDDIDTGDGLGVDFTGIKLAKLGDSNLNGIIDTGDMFVVRTYIQTGKYSCIADCNKNGLIDTGDMFCIKGKIGG